MQKKPRRPRGIGTRKVSISISADDLRVLSARAKAAHGGNLSAVVHDLATTLRREMAMDDVLAALDADRVSADEMAALRAELAPRRKPRKRGAAA
jgi:hypothetical protein